MKKPAIVINRRLTSDFPVALGVNVTWIGDLHRVWAVPPSHREPRTQRTIH